MFMNYGRRVAYTKGLTQYAKGVIYSNPTKLPNTDLAFMFQMQHNKLDKDMIRRSILNQQ